MIGGLRRALQQQRRISLVPCLLGASQSHSYHHDSRQSQRTARRWYAGGLVATAAASLTLYYYKHQAVVYGETPVNDKQLPADEAAAAADKDDRPKARADLPTYRMQDVNKHNGRDSASVWVTYGAGVYDITRFVPQHPGNVTNIMMAAGTAIDPFWQTFQQHNTAAVRELLETFRIGNLHPDDAIGTADLFDPWITEPVRHPLLKPASKKPFNAEPPASTLIANFITPNHVFYVRNHLPVPVIVEDDYELAVEVAEDAVNGDDNIGAGAPTVRTLNMDALRALPKHSVTVTIMCGGNRRSEMHSVRPVRGLHWGKAAVGTAVWSGPRLCDVLTAMGVRSDDTRHVHFEGLDVDATAAPYAASIPLYKAMDPRGDVILAYEMNGEPLTRDHGYPVRVVVPGVVGARHVKWLGRVVVAPAECDSHWQQGDYKGFSPSTGWDTVDFSKSTSMQNMPVTSAICNMEAGDTVSVSATDRMLDVRGYAWSGGGSKILRVDVTADAGHTWHVAELQHNVGEAGKLPTGRNWSWSLWQAHVPLPAAVDGDDESSAGTQSVEVWSKAVDANYNVQPETFENTWNLRGVLSHAYCRVKVNVKCEPTPDESNS